MKLIFWAGSLSRSQFSSSSSSNFKRYPHLYTYSQASSARNWMPCLDSAHDKCTWEIQCAVPMDLSDILNSSSSSSPSSSSPLLDDMPILAICSGQLIHQSFDPVLRRRFFTYTLNAPSLASHIMMAVGPFSLVKFPGWDETVNNVKKSSGGTGGGSNTLGGKPSSSTSKVPDQDVLLNLTSITTNHQEDHLQVHPNTGYAFCLPGWEDDVAYSVETVARVIHGASWVYFFSFSSPLHFSFYIKDGRIYGKVCRLPLPLHNL